MNAKKKSKVYSDFDIEVILNSVELDTSGIGHCWTIVGYDLPSNITDEIVAEIADGNVDCDDYIASNGQHYRWSRS